MLQVILAVRRLRTYLAYKVTPRHYLVLGLILFIFISYPYVSTFVVSRRTLQYCQPVWNQHGLPTDLRIIYNSHTHRSEFLSPSLTSSLSSTSLHDQINSITSPLQPGQKGLCLFHGQAPHHQDMRIFEKLGGTIETTCGISYPLATKSRAPSAATLYPCTAPVDPSAYGQRFLEIGALDGQFLSNLLFFESQMQWRGLCIEGSPHNYEQLIHNRPNCTNINTVIEPGSDGRKATFYTFTKPNGWEMSMSCMQGWSVCRTERTAQEYSQESGTTIRKDTVPISRLADIFSKYGYKKMGWIMVDVEGAESIIFRTIDWNKVCARYVTYEGEHDDVLRMMKGAGYRELESLGVDRLMEPAEFKC